MLNALLPLLLALPSAMAMNGMDMSMDGAMALMPGMMRPYLHFTTGDILWFLGWVPKHDGPMVGACVGLFLLAVFDRWLAACRALGEEYWRKSAQIEQASRTNGVLPKDGKQGSSLAPKPVSSLRAAVSMRMATPFIPANDFSRGIVHAAQSALGFALMLVVMTYQAGFIMAIVLGAGVGETMFGRFASGAAHAM